MMNDFDKYCLNHLGISSLQMENWRKMQDTLYSSSGMVTASVTPNIIEERKMNVAVMDVFSRLMADRIIWVAGPVDDRMAIIVQAQLMFLSQVDAKRAITMHIDSPGGSVKAGLGMVDVMEYIPNDIETINTGMAASMGSVLLGAGTKGMRSSLRHSRTMLHQSSGGAGGNIQDARITFEECDKDPKKVMKDATRDLWLSADEALKYGIIDEVIKPKE
jgi:ATP-dependent Clp protease protease subunit